MQMILSGCHCSQDTRGRNWTQIQSFQKVPFFSVHSLYNFLSWYLSTCELAYMVSEIKEVRGLKEATACMQSCLERSNRFLVALTV